MTARRAKPGAETQTPPTPGSPPGHQEPAAQAAVTRTVADPRTMRAMAHPMRIALMESLAREGPLTASRAAELLDDSPGNMSWHLQTLAKYGFVEEAGGGRGRSRPWRLVSATYNFETHISDPEIAAAGEALESIWMDRNFQRLREWWSRRLSYSAKWRQAAFSSDALIYLTAAEMQQLGEDIHDLTSVYKDRTADKTRRPKGSAPIHVVTFAHPLPPSAAGN